MLKEKQKLEALKRMRVLNLHHNTLEEFEKEGRVNKSEFGGFLYWLNEEEEEIIREWEKETGYLAYHAIFNRTNIGDMLSIFYVSKFEEEWIIDNKDLKEGRALVFVKNIDADMNSEFGTILFETKIGGLVRVG